MSKRFGAYRLKKYLNSAMDAEIQKSVSEMNPDLIDECVGLSLEASDLKLEVPEKRIKSITKSIIARYYKQNIKSYTLFTLILACCAVILMILR